MDEDTKVVAQWGCGCVLAMIIVSAILWAGFIYGTIAVIKAAGG